MGPSFVHPSCCVFTLTWQLSAKSSHGMPSYSVHTNFRMRSAMITLAPKHYLTTLVIDFFILWLHRPRKRMLSSFLGQASAKPHSRLSKCALISSPRMYFDAYNLFFLNSMIPFSTQNTLSRLIILADPQIDLRVEAIVQQSSHQDHQTF